MFSSGYRPTVNYGQSGDIENAKLVAKRIFDMYDKDRNNVLDLYEVAPMMQDAYRSMNRSFQPSKLDVDSYARILDRNSDGKITLADVEALCMRYLVGEYPQGGNAGLKSSQTLKSSGYIAPDAGRYGQGETLKSSEYGGNTASYRRPGEREKSSGLQDNEPKYPPAVQNQLDQARRIFQKYDADHSGFLEETEVPLVLRDTYRAIGMERTFTKDEVDSYIRMIDSNKDGKISLPEYEAIILQTLQKAGIKF